ncbi:MAG: DNA helicase [Microbacteriaceae bacterium]|nr:DNA helicase [Microbacteriaceae bacterium]
MKEFYYGPYRRTMARAARDQDDLFMLYVCGEALGVPNPASYYTMELLPLVLEEFHDWHTRMGMEKWPGDIGLSCC